MDLLLFGCFWRDAFAEESASRVKPMSQLPLSQRQSVKQTVCRAYWEQHTHALKDKIWALYHRKKVKGGWRKEGLHIEGYLTGGSLTCYSNFADEEKQLRKTAHDLDLNDSVLSCIFHAIAFTLRLHFCKWMWGWTPGLTFFYESQSRQPSRGDINI